jgi:predicted nucleic acid-binding protein
MIGSDRMNQVFIDTAPLIYLVEGGSEYRESVCQQLTQWIESDTLLATSTLTLLELLVAPKRKKDLRLERQYRSLLNAFLSVPLIDMNSDIAVLASDYRANLRLKTPDAIQVATAVHYGYELFYTNDRHLQCCTDIDIILVES